MKLILLTAIIAAVAASPVVEEVKGPWQVGKVYRYDVNSYTFAKMEESDVTISSFKAQFLVRVKAVGHLVARFENPEYGKLTEDEFNYQSIEHIDQPFEIFVVGGRVKSLNLPSSFSPSQVNLVKGLISALQVDLPKPARSLFTKMEVDVTGECETLYSVSPMSADWRSELYLLKQYDSIDAPIEIMKSRNYGNCQTRVVIAKGVPHDAIWNGVAYDNEEKQLIKHASNARILASKEGTIYKSDVTGSVFVAPLVFGEKKAEVRSSVIFHLTSVDEDTSAEWKVSETLMPVTSLLYNLEESSFFNQANEQTIIHAQKLLQEITPMLQSPSNLPKDNFLLKFETLVQLLYTMNSEQLAKITSGIEVAKTSKNAAKNNMWIIYRDAVAQTGSVAAFREIKSWVLTKKIQGEEAAEVMASVANSVRYFSKEVMEEFFNFAISPEVLEQQYLNSTALLAAVKVFRLNNNDESFIIETVIPRLSKELKSAVEKSDRKNIQVYIIVLGNLAHPDVVKVFAPYLEGEIKIAKYFRVQMVTSLKKLANMKNEYVRNVLFAILKNTAEDYEVRVAAALNIFLAYPTADMMQVMAYMTFTDPSTQVRAVLQNSIIFAAGLKDPRFAYLAETAQSVMNMVEKEKLSFRYSTDFMTDMYKSDDDMSFFKQLAYIGSEDDTLANYGYLGLRSSTDLTEENSVSMTVSSMKVLQDFFRQLLPNGQSTNVPDFKYSAKKITEMFGIKRDVPSSFEGSLFFDNYNQEELFTFVEDDLESFTVDLIDRFGKSFSGSNVRYTKILNQKQVFVTFPLISGMPFVYSYSEPILLSFDGKVNTDQPESSSVPHFGAEFTATYSRNFDGRVGYLDTLGDAYSYTGVVSKLQLLVPAKFNAVFRGNDIQFKFVFPEQDTNLVHKSVWPYTTVHKKDSYLDIFEEPATKLIKRPATSKLSTDIKVGKYVGVAYQFNGYSYSSDYKNFDSLFTEDLFKTMFSLLYQKDVALTEFDFKYLSKETKNKAVTFDYYYKSLYNMNEDGEMGPASDPNDTPLSSEVQREKLVKQVASGIKSANVKVFDLSAVFSGQEDVEIQFTAALANSYIDPKEQIVVSFHGAGQQVNAVFKTTQPQTEVCSNLEEAFKNDLTVYYEGNLKVGSKLNVDYKGYGKRSSEYTEMLKNDPMTKLCLSEVSKQNLYQKNCYKMLVKAHAPDFFKGTLTYKDADPSDLTFVYYVYEFMKEVYSLDEMVAPIKSVADNTVEFEARQFYYDEYAKYQFASKYGSLNLNMKGFAFYPYYYAIYAPVGNFERAYNFFTGYRRLPYCAVDNTLVSTFSGRSYYYNLTSPWHVVMVEESDGFFELSDLVILARRPSENQEEVYISYRQPTGKYVEIDIKPTNVDIKTNVKKASEGAFTAYWDEETETPLLEYYVLTNGMKVFNIDNSNIRVLYDSQRLLIFTDGFRNTTTGLCGKNSGQTSDDYMTPFGLIDHPQLYGASFSLDDEFSDKQTEEWKKEAKQKAYQPVTVFTTIPLSDDEWSKITNKSFKKL